MTDKQLKEFNEVRKQYLRDLSRLRELYLKKFIAVLSSSRR